MWLRALSFCCLIASASLVYAAPRPNPWPSFKLPAPGPARAIGDYSAGCLQGAHQLALDGPGYQVMRPSRLRYFGHPTLVSFVRELGERVHAQQLGVLLVGDLSQPRGGRASAGHASHQTGLDVDVWYTHPPRALARPLPHKARERLAAQSIVDATAGKVDERWAAHVERVLALAVEDERVDRIFVHPLIKRALCERSSGARAWLRKIRPWYGHDDHFHARLVCPAGDDACQAQAPLPVGDGCDKLTWWLDPEAQAARLETRKAYQQTVNEGRGWPERCDALLSDRRAAD
jgi:penicillin-insensitive murein DD-endopeptidase